MNEILKLLLKNRISHWIVLLGVAIFTFSVFKIDYKPFKVSPNTVLEVWGIVTGASFVLIGFALLFFETKPKKTINLEGKWYYDFEETDLDNQVYKHGGVATIYQSGRDIKIDGFRRYMYWEDENGKITEKKMNAHWATTWACIDESGMLRYDYEMTIGAIAGRINGYVRIHVCKAGTSKPKEFHGIQCMLPPFAQLTPCSKFGTISYKKIEETPKKGFFSRLLTGRSAEKQALPTQQL